MSVLNEPEGLMSVVRLTNSWNKLQISHDKSDFQQSSFYCFLLPLSLHPFASPPQYVRFIILWDGKFL